MQPAWMQAAVHSAATSSPMAMARTPGRVLLADGDALAYYCAGSDGTSPAQARANLTSFLRACRESCGAEAVRVLVTGRGSNKGYRYAVARAKPYQGNRSSSRRPENWEFLRDVIEGGFHPDFPVEVTNSAEADDLFGKYSTELGWQNVVILTQDKDMRMVPGLHLEWKDRSFRAVAPDLWEEWKDDNCFGRKWFWLQMLHGDQADNIPGLPKYITPAGKPALCGEKTAWKLLADTACENDARQIVFGLYSAWYGDAWRVQILEQAVLLWMRRDAESKVLNCMREGGPLYVPDLINQPEWMAAVQEMRNRMAEVVE
jgi:DNA polymerase-1